MKTETEIEEFIGLLLKLKSQLLNVDKEVNRGRDKIILTEAFDRLIYHIKNQEDKFVNDWMSSLDELINSHKSVK